MRLLIVDDDREIVALICETIDWKALGIDDVACAYHLEGAKSAFERHVDIVISDIEMPRGSGLDFIRWARENDIDSEFIFLTCHDSFSFVQEAMKHNAMSYVLKPFNSDELVAEVAKAIDRIRKRDSMNAYGTLWLENRATVEQKFWRDLLLSDAPLPELGVLRSRMENRNLGIESGGRLRLVLVRLVRTAEEVGDEDVRMFDYRVSCLAVEELLKDPALAGRVIPYERHSWRYAACLLPETGEQEAVDRCEAFIQRYRKQFPGNIACYVGDLVEVAFLPRQLIALEELGQSDYSSGVILPDQRQPGSLAQSSENPVDLSQLQELLHRGDKLTLMKSMKEQMETLLAEGKLNLSAMYAIQQSVVQEIFEYLRRHNLQSSFLISDASYGYLQSRAAASTYDMIKWMNYCFLQIVNYEADQRRAASVSERAMAFIHNHFAENITREEVARQVCLAPEYFAKQFKREVGMPVKDYINRCRVQAAEKLLKTTDLSVTEVAGRVGFSDGSYFTVVFKKTLGVSPTEYRQNQ